LAWRSQPRRIEREEWRSIVEREGGRVVLVFLDAGEEVLRVRIRERAGRDVSVDADRVFVVSERAKLLLWWDDR